MTTDTNYLEPEWYFNGSSSRSADELNLAVLQFAIEEGMGEAMIDASFRHEIETSDDRWSMSWLDNPDDAEWLAELATAACDWITEHRCAPNTVAYFDDGFGISHINEDGEFVDAPDGTT